MSGSAGERLRYARCVWSRRRSLGLLSAMAAARCAGSPRGRREEALESISSWRQKELLFEGIDLTGWRTVGADGSAIEVVDGELQMASRGGYVGLALDRSPLPRQDFELQFDCKWTQPDGPSLAVVVPVPTGEVAVRVWRDRGALTGVERLDGRDAAANLTLKSLTLELGAWYRVRVQVTDRMLFAWLNDLRLARVVTVGTHVSLPPALEAHRGLSINTRSGLSLRAIELWRGRAQAGHGVEAGG
jgi:hypothetical protein